MAIKNYDSKQVSMIIAGISIDGTADGTFVVAARNNDSFNISIGSDGEGARAQSNDKSGTVTFTLMQNSSSNDLLSALSNLDEATGDGVGPFLLKDNTGTTLVVAESAWIRKPSDVEYGREISNREWVIETDVLDIFSGGN